VIVALSSSGHREAERRLEEIEDRSDEPLLELRAVFEELLVRERVTA
jgi:hypothetical protein